MSNWQLYRDIFHNDRCPNIWGNKEDHYKIIDSLYENKSEKFRNEIKEIINHLYSLQELWIFLKNKGIEMISDFDSTEEEEQK